MRVAPSVPRDRRDDGKDLEMHAENQHPHRQPRLNFDVLHRVCDCLISVSDVLSFAFTCSMLTKPAFLRRLKMTPIDLWSGELVDSFYSFIFADKAVRAPCIYGLKLPDPYDYDVGEHDPRFQIINGRLVDILQAAVSLEYLSFPVTVSLPVLASAANVTTLRKLCMEGEPSEIFREESAIWEVLTAFRSPIQFLRINGGELFEGCLSASSLHDHFANFARTLEILELECLYLNMSPSSVTTQFTAIRSLKIGTISNFTDMGVLLQLFPNLDGALEVLDTVQESEGEEYYSTLQEGSQEVQETRSWPRLDRLVCDVKSAFLMALQCPIRSMDIDLHWSHAQRLARYNLASILQHNCPQRLHLGVSLCNGSDGLDELLLPPNGMDNLTHLIMFVDVTIRFRRKKPKPVPWNQFMDKLVDLLKHLRLTHLRLVFHFSAHQSDKNAFRERDTVFYIAGETDLYPLATRLIIAMPTLQYVFLTTCGHTYDVPPQTAYGAICIGTTLNAWLSSKAWLVNHSQPDIERRASCTKLTVTDAEKVMNEEELYLSRAEEDMVRKCGISATRRA